MGDSDRSLLKAVKHYQECLDKYTESRNDAKLIHCLDKLQKLPIKVSHLEQTGVGRTVNGLRKFGGRVGESAKSLVTKWKDMVVGEQEEEDDDDDDDDEEDDDQEDGYESGDPESSIEEKEEDAKRVAVETDNSSSHRQSDNHRTDDERHRSKKSKYSDSEKHSSKKEKDHQNGHSSSKHRSHKRKTEEDSDEERHYKRRKKESSEEEDTEEYKSKEKKHKSKNNNDSENSKKDKQHKSSEKSKKPHDSSSDFEDNCKSYKNKDAHRSSSSSHEKKDKHKNNEKSSTSSSSSSKKVKHEHRKTKEDESKKEKKSSSSSSSNSKSKDRESSKSKEHKEEKSSSSKSKSVPISKSGIDSGSGASFAEALGMCEPSSSSKNSQKKKEKDKEKPIAVPVFFEKEKKDKPSKSDDSVPKLLKEPVQDPFDLNISSLLPTITPNYRPLGNSLLADSQPKKVLSDYEQLSNIITSKNQRTKVYSGNKTGYGKVPSLFESCIRVLQDNIDALEYTGGVPYIVLKPILEKSTPNQLFTMEHHNPYLIEDTDELWQIHCQKAFRNKKREELETWREMFMRCSDEREAKLKALTANIKQSQDKSLPVRTTKLAYVDDVVKPPRNVARKQMKNGTAFDKKPALTPSARLSSLATAGEAGRVAVPNPGARAMERSGSQVVKPKKAPLMAKSLSLLKNRFRR